MDRLFSEEKSQGAVEYTMLIAGIIGLVVIVIVLLRTQLVPVAKENIAHGVSNYTNIIGSFNQTPPP